MKPSNGNLLVNLFEHDYSRKWEPEKDFTNLSSDNFSSAVYALRIRTGLSHAQLSFFCRGELTGAKAIEQLEMKGRPARPAICKAFASLAWEYGLPKLAKFFERKQDEYLFGKRKGRPYKREDEEMSWF